MIAYVEAQKETGKDYTQDATLLWGTTGGTILKEMHRFASTRFVNSISPRYYGSEWMNLKCMTVVLLIDLDF